MAPLLRELVTDPWLTAENAERARASSGSGPRQAMPGEANPVAKPCSGINDSHLPLADEFRYIWGMGHLLGYARVSTAVGQDVALQRDTLTAAGCYRVFVDTASGALDARPALTEVLDQLRPEDTLVVWRLDRLGRSIRHLIDLLADLETRGIGFRSMTESIDTTSPGGRLVFHLFAALAQFERELIKERTNAGLAAARARGRRGGRPPRLTGDQVNTARRLYDQKELTVGQIGDVLGVSRTTIYRALDRQAQAGTASIERPSRRKVAPART